MKKTKFDKKEDALLTYRVSEIINGVPVYVERDVDFGSVKNTPYKKHDGSLDSFLASNEVCYYDREGKPTLYKGYDMYGNLLIHEM